MNILHLEDSTNDAVLIEALVYAEWPDCRITRVSMRAQYQNAIETGGFDLILSDYAMPDFDGLSALELAHARCPETPFIFMSGTIGEERAIEALKRGATDYIIKDRPTRLIPAIRQALGHVEEAVRLQNTEQALRENQQRFQQLADQSNEVFWFLSVNPLQTLYVSPAVEQLWGIPAARFYEDAQFWIVAIHEDDRSRVRNCFAAWIKGESPVFEEEYRVVRPDGSVLWVLDSGTLIRDAEGKVYRVSGIAKDITTRRLADERLREQAALLDHAQDAIYVRDLDQHITYWNRGAERIYGWTAEEVLGRRAVELLYKEDTSALLAIRRTVLEKGEWSGELRQLDKNGREVIVMARRNLLRDGQGRPVSILNINTDVTEHRKLETQLLRTQRMESIGTLTGGIAHDLNNVLSPILMGAELLNFSKLDDSARKTVGAIANSAQHGASLVRQLLAFARGTEGERAVVQMRPLLADLEILLRQTLPNSIELGLACAPDCRPVLADATQLKQVVLNLCINARDAMPAGGAITITTEDVLVDAALARSLPEGRPGEHLRISVADTGTGMPPEVIEKIFDPFFTTKEVGKGTGLGLSTVRGIAKGHGGFLQVESEVGNGTTFHLYLPALMVAPAPAGPASGAAEIPGGRGEIILVVDDDSGVCEMMKSLLEYHGYRVITACDGREGLERFRNCSGRIAVVITDLLMPVMNGVEVIAAVRTLDSAVPIIAISSLSVVGKRMPDFDQRTVSAAIDKPINTSLLLGILRRVITHPHHPHSSPRHS